MEDDFAVAEPTRFNKPVFLVVEVKGLPVGQPAGPEPDLEILFEI